MKISSLYYLTFFPVLILDYLIRSNFLGNRIKTYYIKFTKLPIISISFSMFIVFVFVLSIFSYLDIHLLTYINDNYIQNNFDNYMSENNGDSSPSNDEEINSNKK